VDFILGRPIERDLLFPGGELDRGPTDEAREIAPELVRVPWAIELDGEWLVWSEHDEDRFSSEPFLPKTTKEARDAPRMHAHGCWHLVRHSRRLLDGFLNLAASTPEGIRDFARRNGVLELCVHRLPACHHSEVSFVHSRIPKCWPDGWTPTRQVGRERLADWIRYATWARAALAIAAELRVRRPGRFEDWEALPESLTILRGYGGRVPDWENEPSQPPPGPSFPNKLLGKDVEFGAMRLRQFLTAWLRVAQFAPRLRSSGGADVIRYGPSMEWGGLFAVLGFQLASRIAGRTILLRCDRCGGEYDGARAPIGGRAILCRQCRPTAREKYRDRQRRAMELHARGTSVREIATKVKRPVATVQRWVKRARVR
jgi:hypothetical protein